MRSSLIVLDEIHKYKKWRNLIKGFYDKQKNKHQFLVTGSARIDHYSKGGDSFVGRYHLYRMHPLSVNELGLNSNKEIQRLIDFGGFPEPYFLGDITEAKRWRRERLRRVALEDIRDLEQVKDISSVEHLLSILPPVISSQLSYQSLANEIEVDPKTVQKWIEIFDNLYITYRDRFRKFGWLKFAEILSFYRRYPGRNNGASLFERRRGSRN